MMFQANTTFACLSLVYCAILCVAAVDRFMLPLGSLLDGEALWNLTNGSVIQQVALIESRLNACIEGPTSEKTRTKRGVRGTSGSKTRQGYARSHSRHGMSKPWGPEDTKKVIDVLITIVSTLSEVFPYGQVVSNTLNIIADVTVRSDEQKEVLDFISQSFDKSVYKLSQMEVQIQDFGESLMDNLGGLAKYAEERRKIQVMSRAYKLMMTKNNETQELAVHEFRRKCQNTLSLMNVVDTIETLFSSRFGTYGSLMISLVEVAGWNRETFFRLSSEIRGDLCILIHHHSICNSYLIVPIPVIENDRKHIINVFRKVLNSTAEADEYIARSFRTEATLMMNNIEYDELSNATYIQEVLQKKLYWVNISVLTFTKDDDYPDHTSVLNNCTILRRYKTKSVLVYFSEPGKVQKLATELASLTNVVLGQLHPLAHRFNAEVGCRSEVRKYIDNNLKGEGKWSHFSAVHYRLGPDNLKKTAGLMNSSTIYCYPSIHSNPLSPNEKLPSVLLLPVPLTKFVSVALLVYPTSNGLDGVPVALLFLVLSSFYQNVEGYPRGSCEDPNQVWSSLSHCEAFCREDSHPCTKNHVYGCRCRKGFKRYEKGQTCFPEARCYVMICPVVD